MVVCREVNLLTSLPKARRDVNARGYDKTPEVIATAKKFGVEYFDGDRKYGYGGYRFDGRWQPVAKSLIKFFGLKRRMRVLDIGCAKGFLVRALKLEFPKLEVCGIDISRYALDNCPPGIGHLLEQYSATELPYMDNLFDLVISINTLHNLPRPELVKALREIERVTARSGNAYIVVDSYRTPEEKALFEKWCLTAEFHGYPHEWLAVFEEAGYTGYYSWNILTE
jgi:ubiquinone/menaquinone biosynthesis C-methylase UbiE